MLSGAVVCEDRAGLTSAIAATCKFRKCSLLMFSRSVSLNKPILNASPPLKLSYHERRTLAW